MHQIVNGVISVDVIRKNLLQIALVSLVYLGEPLCQKEGERGGSCSLLYSISFCSIKQAYYFYVANFCQEI